MLPIELKRPLAFFDLETTGTDPQADKIVEISVMRLDPGGGLVLKTRRLNPGRPIPPEASRIHGIRDEDVRDAPTFRQVARSLLDLLEGADLAGFNILRFDLPLLQREFREAGFELDLSRRRIVDVMSIFHRMEPRDLSAAVRFYLGKDHAGAHGAEADVKAAAEVLAAQIERYPELPRSVEELDAWLRPGAENRVDREGKFVWQGDGPAFAFGRHAGKLLEKVAAEDRGYLEWILGSDFPEDAKAVVRRVLDGDPPRRESGKHAAGDEPDQST